MTQRQTAIEATALQIRRTNRQRGLDASTPADRELVREILDEYWTTIGYDDSWNQKSFVAAVNKHNAQNY